MTRSKTLLTENSRTALTLAARGEMRPQKTKQFLGAALATISAFSMGMCLAWTSPAVPRLKEPASHPQITETEGAWLASLLNLGAFLGAIPTGFLANQIGRKRTLQTIILPVFASWLMLAFGESVYTLYAARILAGLAIGAISVAAPMYVAELAHSSIRGTLGTFFQVQITVGLLVEYIFGGTITDLKMLSLVAAIFPILFLISFSFMPETPTYLYSKGRVLEARAALAFYRGDNYFLDDELGRIAEDIKEASANQASFSDLFSCKATRRGMLVSLGLMFFQQLSGINAVLFYAGSIFKDTGSEMAPEMCAVLVGAVQVVATLLSTILIDKAGRKILLFVSSFVMCICLVSLGAYTHVKDDPALSYLSFVPLVCLAVFIVVFSIGFGPIPWMMMGEIFTPKTKGMASSISAACNWLLAFTVTNQFSTMITYLGMGFTFIVFGAICGLGSAFVVIIVPETKGKDVDQVQRMLQGEKRCSVSGEATTAV